MSDTRAEPRIKGQEYRYLILVWTAEGIFASHGGLLKDEIHEAGDVQQHAERGRQVYPEVQAGKIAGPHQRRHCQLKAEQHLHSLGTGCLRWSRLQDHSLHFAVPPCCIDPRTTNPRSSDEAHFQLSKSVIAQSNHCVLPFGHCNREGLDPLALCP